MYYVLGVSIFASFVIYRFDFGNVPTVCSIVVLFLISNELE